jgi:TldD protein
MKAGWCLLAALAALPLAAQPDDAILRAIADEMQRSRLLKTMPFAQPYYFEYTLHDGDNVTASATLGALGGSRRVRFRIPEVAIRVGDYQFDNTNYVGTGYYSGTRYDVAEFPIDDSYPVLRHHLWLATDMAYKTALEGFSHKRAALRDVAPGEALPDFYPAKPVGMVTAAPMQPIDEKAWAERVRRLSAVFLSYPGVIRSTVSFEGGSGRLYLVTSEGARIRIPESSTALRVLATAQAPDGMPLRDAAIFYALDPGRMPSDAEMERAAREVATDLTALVQAPVGEAYAGPVLFEGAAAGQLFAELLGKNLALPRRPVSLPGRPLPFAASELENRLGTRILPEWMDVVDDPSQVEWHGRTLFGHYEVDQEGVKAERVPLVEKGVLKNFLLTRQPVKGFTASNGHARLPGSFGARAAGVGNLFVSATAGVPSAELRKRLIDLCHERNKPYGILIRKMDFPSSASLDEIRRMLAGMAQSGGAARPVSLPLLAYRVYPDGREELVRGLRFRGLNTRSLKDILAASNEAAVFDYYDSSAPFAMIGGAAFVSEASVIAPSSVLIDDVELERIQEELPRPPVVPPPPLAALEAAPRRVQ